MTITEMRNKRAKLWNTMEGFLDTHRNDMGVQIGRASCRERVSLQV